jgi:nicotinamide mononucleotide adenylyltransferase
MKSRIDYNRPTAMMLGRWQPWHKGHQELFKKALERTGQVIIMIRSMPNF